MKRVFLILFLSLFLISWSNADSKEFKLRKSFPVSFRSNIYIDTKDCFYFDYDIDRFFQNVYYSHGKNADKQLIDTVEFSPYPSIMHCFKSKDSYIILLEVDAEFSPTYYAYFIKDGKVTRIGEWKISTPCRFMICNGCDDGHSYDYPAKAIRIFQKDEGIEFTFLQEVHYLKDDEGDWDFYEAGALKISFDVANI